MVLLAGAAALVSTSRYGPTMTTVSADYLSAAQSFAAGDGFVEPDGSVYEDYPPLYPMLLAVPVALGAPTQGAARWFNAALIGLIVILTMWWLDRNLKSKALVISGGAVVLVAPCLLNISTSAFPETLFILLIVLTVWALQKAQRHNGVRWYALAAFLAALCALARYLGIAAIAAGALLLLFSNKRGSVPRRLSMSALFALAALIPTIAWMVRNAVVAGSAWGSRAPASVSVVDNITFMTNIVATWMFPEAIPAPVRVGTIVLLAVFLAIWVATRGIRQQRENVLPLVFFVVAYLVLLLAVASTVALDRMNNRFLVPVYVPAVVLTFVALDDLLHRRRPLRYVATGVLILWCLLYARYSFRNVMAMHARGAGGYNTVAWQESEIIRELRRWTQSRPVYSNDPYAVMVLVGIPCWQSPRRYEFNSPDSPTDDLEYFLANVETSTGTYLVWLNAVERDYLYPVADLQQWVTLTATRRASDGVVYEVGRRAGD
jgi:4-amino-4-deoxy-L-arabinose transferase-like glycosyltransferase